MTPVDALQPALAERPAVRLAPPARVTVLGVAWRAVQSMIHALGTGALAAWAASHAGSTGPVIGLSFVLAAALAGVIAWHRAKVAEQVLGWDGQAWRLDGREVHVALMLDLASSMLLRVEAPGLQRRWIGVTAGEAGPSWHALRVAVHARHGDPDPDLQAPSR